MSRKLSDLNPIVAEKCRSLIKECNEKGIEILITSTLRTEAEQAALYAQGRKGLNEVNSLRAAAGMPPITGALNKIKTKNLTSIHQFGCAFDIAITIGANPRVRPSEGQTHRSAPTYDITADLNENDIPDYEEIGAIGEALGLRWGGRFSFKDYGHFEFSGGLTIADLKEGKMPERQQ
jgi:peptidoglycan L-alanyl-D-glutamate endopeptidase CwlK